MELKTEKPAHGTFAYLGEILEHFIAFNAFIVADFYRGGIDVGDAGAFYEAPRFEKKQERNNQTGL